MFRQLVASDLVHHVSSISRRPGRRGRVSGSGQIMTRLSLMLLSMDSESLICSYHQVEPIEYHQIPVRCYLVTLLLLPSSTEQFFGVLVLRAALLALAERRLQFGASFA